MSDLEREGKALLDAEKRWVDICRQTEHRPAVTVPTVRLKQTLKYLDIAISARVRFDALRQKQENNEEDQLGVSREKAELLYHRASLLVKCGYFEEAEAQIRHLQQTEKQAEVKPDSPSSNNTNVVLLEFQSKKGKTLNGQPGQDWMP